MELTTYNYSVSGDTANSKVDVGALHSEIASSEIVISIEGASARGNLLSITFKAALSAEDKVKLDDLVSTHEGNPIQDPATESGTPIVHLDVPEEEDGKPVFVLNPSPEGLLTYFTGRGDDFQAQSRGTGPQIRVDFSPGESYPAVKETTWSYMEATRIHDGQLCWNAPEQFSPDDHFSLSVNMPATEVVEVGTGGNCNLVPTGQGFNLIVPAEDGQYQVDLSKATPVFANRRAPDGYWDCDLFTGEVTAGENAGESRFHLMDIPIKSYFLRCVSMVNPRGVFDVDAYKTEWVHPNYSWTLEVFKALAPSETCSVAGWVLLFRQNAT